MRTEAVVIAVEDRVATIKLNRKSACEGCHKSEDGKGCSVCSLLGADREFTATAKNPIGARVGDRVEVETESSRVLFYAALVFLLPLLCALLFWGIATIFTDQMHWKLLTALLGFIASFAGVWFYSERIRKNQQDIVIVSVLEKSEQELK